MVAIKVQKQNYRSKLTFFQSTFSVTLKIIMKSAIKMHKTCENSIIFIVTKKCHDKKNVTLKGEEEFEMSR